MNIPTIKVAWRSHSLLLPGETTDIDGYAPREFHYNDGTTEQLLVRNDNDQSSCYQRKLFESPTCLIEIQLWHTKDFQEWRVVGTISKYQEKVEVP